MENIEEQETENVNSANQSNNRPWLFKKGQSGNPSGRPKGTISLKEYARRYLQEMSEEEKIEFMEGLSKDIIWKMAEGNPMNATDITSQGEKILVMPGELINKNESNTIAKSNS